MKLGGPNVRPLASWSMTLRYLTGRFGSKASTFGLAVHFSPLTHIGESRKLIPKNEQWLRGYLGNFFQTFSRFCNFGAWLRGFSGIYFQVNFMSTYPWKNIFFPKTGHDSEAFPENFSRRISDATSQEKVFINTFWWHLGLKWEVS